MALVNRHVLLEYDVGGPRLWHERLVAEHVSGDSYIVITPDSDVYMEDLGLLNGDLRSIRVRPGPGLLPGGMAGANIYSLPAFSANELSLLREEAKTLAEVERRGLVPAVAPGVASVAGQSPVPVAEVVQSFPAGTLKWLSAETFGGYTYGQEVVAVTTPKARGAKALHGLEGGRHLFVECVDGDELKAYLQKPALNDSRVLPIEFNSLGQPERTLKEVAALCKEVPTRWVLSGPRTSRWCVNYLAIENLGFEGHHERLRQVTKADASSWGIQEHFQLSMSLRQALLVDQVDAYNLLSVEIQFRRLQTIEFSYSEKAKELEAKAVGGRLSLEEQTCFGGVTRQYSTLLICPELLDYVKAETEKDPKTYGKRGKKGKQLAAARKAANKQKTLEFQGARW